MRLSFYMKWTFIVHRTILTYNIKVRIISHLVDSILNLRDVTSPYCNTKQRSVKPY